MPRSCVDSTHFKSPSSSPWMFFLMRSRMVVCHWSRREMESNSLTCPQKKKTYVCLTNCIIHSFLILSAFVYKTYCICKAFTVLFLIRLEKFLIRQINFFRKRSNRLRRFRNIGVRYLQQLALSGVRKSWKHLLVFFNSNL